MRNRSDFGEVAHGCGIPAEIEDVQCIRQDFGLGICVGKDEWQTTVSGGDTVETLWEACGAERADHQASWVSRGDDPLITPVGPALILKSRISYEDFVCCAAPGTNDAGSGL